MNWPKKWSADEMTKDRNDWLMKWLRKWNEVNILVKEMNTQQNDQAIKCPSGERTGQRNDQLMKWLVDEMAEKWNEVNKLVKEINTQWNDQALKCLGGKLTCQSIDHLMKWLVDKMSNRWGVLLSKKRHHFLSFFGGNEMKMKRQTKKQF